jgi:hypothetical protein
MNYQIPPFAKDSEFLVHIRIWSMKADANIYMQTRRTASTLLPHKQGRDGRRRSRGSDKQWHWWWVSDKQDTDGGYQASRTLMVGIKQVVHDAVAGTDPEECRSEPRGRCDLLLCGVSRPTGTSSVYMGITKEVYDARYLMFRDRWILFSKILIMIFTASVGVCHMPRRSVMVKHACRFVLTVKSWYCTTWEKWALSSH